MRNLFKHDQILSIVLAFLLSGCTGDEKPFDTANPDTSDTESTEDTSDSDTTVVDTSDSGDTSDTNGEETGSPPDTASVDTADTDTDTDSTSGPGPNAVPDFLLADINPNSSTLGQNISPRDYLQQISGWYFIKST